MNDLSATSIGGSRDLLRAGRWTAGLLLGLLVTITTATEPSFALAVRFTYLT